MAYAAVVSLKQTIEQLPSVVLPSFKVVQSIYEEVVYLQSFLESISSLQSSETRDALESRIRDAVDRAQDLIKSHMADLSISRFNRSLSLSLFSQELLKVEPEITFLTETVANKLEEYNIVSSRTHNGGRIRAIRLDDEVRKIKQWLLGGSNRLDFITIVGMAGIGKTALARKVYCDLNVIFSFSCHCFVTMGPKFQLRQFLLLVLDQLGFYIDEKQGETEYELREVLYKSLKGRRYLIVIDDVWDTQVWDEFKRLFPDDNNRSRIILTTRLVDIASRGSTSGHILQVPFLNDDQSWDLLREKVFATEKLHHSELEIIGKKIARSCEGLPLAILAVGSLLRKTEKTAPEWKKVAEDENSLVAPISEALSLSYKELPQQLKECFLYMGVFPRNYEIPTSKLIKLWVAEGLFEQESSKSLEEKARECLDDLVSRSLVLVHERSSREGTKTCKMHFVFRILCVSEAQNERFFHVVDKYASCFPKDTNSQCRLCIHNNVVLGLKEVRKSMELESAACSLLFLGQNHQKRLQVYLSYKLLRVLDALTIRFYKFLDEVLELVQLRYLAITIDGELPACISRLRKLEVLIVHLHQRIKSSDAPVYLPMDIWNLRALKHLECTGFDLPDPSAAAKGNDDGCDNSLILEKLEKLLTLSGVSAHSCTHKILARLPNLMKLGIWIDPRHEGVETFSSFGDYSCLHLLESFKWIIVHPYPESTVVVSHQTFSYNLRKITLSGCGFSWVDMTYIGSLPNLEVLKLRCYSFQGRVWKLIEGEFPKLKFLLLEDLDVEHWEGNYDHFPFLKRLIIRHCYKLHEIPRSFGDIPALAMIEVDDCTPSVVISARQIQDDQQELGNDGLLVRILSSCDDKKKHKS